jgi:Outer membrane protein beta-barrel domain
MKRILLYAALVLCLSVPTLVLAQNESTYNHAEVGVFADYMNYSASHPHINFIGVGGRLGVNVHPNVQLEAEMAYDFKRNYTNTFNNGLSTTFQTTRLRPLTGLFGPKFQAGSSGPVRVFLTGKVGFINFSNASTVTGTAFTNQVSSITTGDTRFALYPGVGVEAFGGPIGIRLEVGDEVYFLNGSHNNLKVTFGPAFRF